MWVLVCDLWYDGKQKYGKREQLFYMETDSFIVYIKTDDINKDIAEDVEIRFDTSNYELDSVLPKGKSKNVIGLMKDEIGGKDMTKFVGLRARTYSYLIDEGSEDKKPQNTEKCVIKRKLNLKIIKTV